MSAPAKKITSFDNIVIGTGCQFTTGNFKNSSGAVISLPASAATLSTVSLAETLTNKTLTEPEIATIKNSSATLTVPSTTGTLALQSEVVAQEERIDRLVAYLKAWIGVGNVNMDDIDTAVDPVAQQQQEPEGEGEGEGQ